VVFGFAVAVFSFALISSHLVWYRCGIRLRCGGIQFRPNLLHARHGIVVVFGFTVAVFGFALISSHPGWYRYGIQLLCGIRLCCGGIQLQPNLLHAQCGIIVVFSFAVAVSFFAPADLIIVVSFFAVMVSFFARF